MKRILFTLIVGLAAMLSASALTFQEAFDEVKALPDGKGMTTEDVINKTLKSVSFPIQNLACCVKSGQSAEDTEYYGNSLFSIMDHIDPATLVKAYGDDQVLFSIFAQESQSKGQYDILVLYDNAEKGFCVAMLGQIAAAQYQLLQQGCIIAYDKNTNICLYIEAFGFGGD